MTVHSSTIRVKNRAARWLTEVFQPPVVVSIQLLISPVTQPGFPGTVGYGALAALFVCVLPLFLLLILGPAWLPLLLLIPAVGWSRVVLRAHSAAQVIAGSLFGGVVMAGIWWLLQGWLVIEATPQ